MPISGGAPGLTFNFVTETETVPSGGNLVLGDAKILCAWGSDGVLDLWHKYGPAGGNWGAIRTPAGDDIDEIANTSIATGFISIEAAMWRIENAIAAVRSIRLSVINVG